MTSCLYIIHLSCQQGKDIFSPLFVTNLYPCLVGILGYNRNSRCLSSLDFPGIHLSIFRSGISDTCPRIILSLIIACEYFDCFIVNNYIAINFSLKRSFWHLCIFYFKLEEGEEKGILIHPWVGRRVLRRLSIFSRTIDICTHVRPTSYVHLAIPGSRAHVGMYRAVRKLQSPSDGCGRSSYWREAIRLRRIGGEPAIFETEKRRHDRLIREHLIYSFTVARASRSHTVVHRVGQMGRITDARAFHRVKFSSQYPPFSVGPNGSIVGVCRIHIYYGTIDSHIIILFNISYI